MVHRVMPMPRRWRVDVAVAVFDPGNPRLLRPRVGVERPRECGAGAAGGEKTEAKAGGDQKATHDGLHRVV